MSKEVKRYTLFASLRSEAIAFLPDEVVSARDYDALLAERDELMKWKQTAEYWYGQYRLVKHGESPAEHPTEGKLDGWHNSYHNA